MMKTIIKYHSDSFKEFDWLDFDYLPNSNGYRCEISFQEIEDRVAQSIMLFNSLFKSFQPNFLIKTFGQDNEWGNFCIDTWDIENDRYDYSPANKEEPTASYLKMLKDSNIEPTFTGFCKCIDWDSFLYIILHCIMQHKAPYSMMFYEQNEKFVFYFHHSGSIGLYYKELNEGVKKIIKSVKNEGLLIRNINAYAGSDEQ